MKKNSIRRTFEFGLVVFELGLLVTERLVAIALWPLAVITVAIDDYWFRQGIKRMKAEQNPKERS